MKCFWKIPYLYKADEKTSVLWEGPDSLKGYLARGQGTCWSTHLGVSVIALLCAGSGKTLSGAFY